MSDEALRNGEAREPDVFAVAFPFPAIDALMYEILRQSKPLFNGRLETRRLQVTIGSVMYEVKLRINSDTLIALGTIFIYMLDERLTSIETEVNGHLPEQVFSGAASTINTFVSIAIGELMDRRTAALERIETLGHPIVPHGRMSEEDIDAFLSAFPQPSQKPLGRRPNEDNQWARGEIQKGRDRAEVFAEYLNRQEVDRDDVDEVEKARDRFRKALRRKEGNK